MDGTKKILRVGILAEVTNLDPAKAQDVDSMLVMRQVVEAPFEFLCVVPNAPDRIEILDE